MRHGRLTVYDEDGEFLLEGIYIEDRQDEKERDCNESKRQALINTHLNKDKELVIQIQNCVVNVDIQLSPTMKKNKLRYTFS